MPENDKGSRLRRHLRPEARPLKWKDLDSEQQNAFEQVKNLLQSAVDVLDRREQTAPEGDLGWLDRDRSSRIIMLAGARGAGKTTALLSIIQGNYKKDEAFEQLWRRLVWLEPLDMEPLAKSVNLLAGILVRIEAAINKAKTQAGTGHRNEGSQLASVSDWDRITTQKDPYFELLKLASDVALTWDGNLSARGGNLDPDVFATEVLRTERARLSLNRRMTDLLDRLARSFYPGREPLFVLPIDDFDLNPAQAVPLLRLLRMVTAPRLFTIVLGDEDMARKVFALTYQGELMEAVAPTGTLDRSAASSLRETADQIGLSALRKLLPPGQRIYLHPMRAHKVLNLVPPDAKPTEESPGDGPLTIGNMLSQFKLKPLWSKDDQASQFKGHIPLAEGHYTEVTSLQQIIDVERLIFTDPNKADSNNADVARSTPRRRGAYSGRFFFRQTARRMHDLWAKLHHIHTIQHEQNDESNPREGLEDKKVRYLLNFLAEQARQAIQEDPLLPSDVRKTLQGMIEPNWEGDFELDAHYLKLVAPHEDLLPTRCTIQVEQTKAEAPTEPELEGRLLFRQVNQWYLQAITSQLDTQPIQASRQLRAALTLFSDHVSMHDRDRLARGSIRPDPFELGCATAEWRLLRREVQEPTRIQWPAPNWESLWPYDLLSTFWSEAVRWVDPQRERARESSTKTTDEHNIEFLAYIWILTATSLVVRIIPKQVSGEVANQNRIHDWERLAEATHELIDLADNGGWRHRHIHSWLLNLACLLAPECGLPSRLAKPFVDRLQGYWSRPLHAEEIRLSRARMMNLSALQKSDAGLKLASYFCGSDEHTSHPINQIEDGCLRPHLLHPRSKRDPKPGNQEADAENGEPE